MAGWKFPLCVNQTGAAQHRNAWTGGKGCNFEFDLQLEGLRFWFWPELLASPVLVLSQAHVSGHPQNSLLLLALIFQGYKCLFCF